MLFNQHYEVPDTGYFDKDEQGWCATRICVQGTSERMEIRDYFDANGRILADQTYVGQVIGQEGDELVIQLESWPLVQPSFAMNPEGVCRYNVKYGFMVRK